MDKEDRITADLKYHYCSMAVFKSIIENKELWLCNARHSSDSYELQYIIHIAKKMKENREISPEQYNEIDKFYKDLQGYITCFSKKANLLSQWRGYADDGKGFSVGFYWDLMRDGDYLRLLEDSQMYFEPVKYIDKNLDVIKNFIKGFDEKNGLWGHWNKMVYWLEQYTWKADFFKEEDEVRLIYIPTKNKGYKIDSEILSKMEFRQTQGKISPFFRLKFKTERISRIIIGPKNNITVDEVKLFLMASGFDETSIDIEKSKIPYC